MQSVGGGRRKLPPKPLAGTTHLVGQIHTLETGEMFQWSDPKREPLQLVKGVHIVVITDEGALRRGRRRWHPGHVGTVIEAHESHPRGWWIRINGHRVMLFSDEMLIASPEAVAAAA